MSSPAHCPKCGRQTPSGARFCPGCGFDLFDRRPRLATGLLPVNQLLNNRYLVEQKLAQGGQSAVYLVMDMRDGNSQRAVKEMSESNLGPSERDKAIHDFIREAEMLQQLRHPALAKVYDRFVEGQKHYLVMEYVRGHNLEDELIETGRPLEWQRVIAWGIALSDVLHYLHTQNPPIIYRDLKPANVMLQPDGAIKLIDFGIARWLRSTQSHDTAQLGTDGYAPIEQYTARSEIRSDLYALGASLYHLLTGRVPESAPMRMAGSALTPIREINPSVPEPVQQVVLRALSVQARDRFIGAPQMREALEWAGAGDRQVGEHIRVTTGARITRTAGPVGSGPPAHPTAARGASQALAPRLHVWPLRLDAGFLEANEAAELRLEIANRGGGQLAGRTETNMHCLTVEPAALHPGIAALHVTIDTNGLLAGPYTCHIAVRTNGGDQIVPVRFIVRSPMPGAGTAAPYVR